MKKFLILPLGVLGVFLLSACDDGPECKYNDDCKVAAGEICQKGKCVVSGFYISDTADTSTDGGTDDNGQPVNTDTVSETVPTQGGTTEDTFESDTASLLDSSGTGCNANSQCDDDNPCTADFCDVSVSPSKCSARSKPNGTVCGEDDPCLGRATCESGECVAQSPPCPAEIVEEECVRYETVCDAGAVPMCAYLKTPINEGGACVNGDPCKQGVCTAGECIGTSNPCDGVTNACTSVACISSGASVDDFTCEYSLAPDGQYCVLNATESACYTTPSSPTYILGYCVGNGVTSDCIVSLERKCYDPENPNICTSSICEPGDGTCEELTPIDVSVHASCGDTVVLEAADFLTRDYYQYNGGSCSLYDARGKEVAVTVDVATATTVTVEVVDSGGQDILLNHLSDMCNPNSCQSNDFDTLTVPDMTSTDAILVEAGIGMPPESIELTVTCADIAK